MAIQDAWQFSTLFTYWTVTNIAEGQLMISYNYADDNSYGNDDREPPRPHH